ncbi:hypothetical protein [Maricaulis salignorans]|uniref:hypothetical protein n=1 Tax=Maricaulis salignorans TaxID=144026 RepID=UPI003A911761
MYHSQRSPNRRPGRGTQYPPGRPLEMPDPAQTGRTALVAAAGAMREGDGRAARQLLAFARDFFAQTRAEMALNRERLKLDAEIDMARRRARAAEYAAAGLGLEGIEFNLQIEEDAVAMRAARDAGKPVPEPRWKESWELAGETMPEGWEEPGCDRD